MRIQSFKYNLPKKLIAQKPRRERDSSRLMTLDRQKKTIKTGHFFDLEKNLGESDVLVLNNTKVFPARLIGKKNTGGKAEIFLLNKISAQGGKNNLWQCLVGTKKKHPGLKIFFKGKLTATLQKKLDQSVWQIKFNRDPLLSANKFGLVPTPPYIKQTKNQAQLKKQYQTIFAKSIGSVAAPTAGLHFTDKLLKKLKNKGVKIEFITLHVGLGTFQPLAESDLDKIKLHSELGQIKKEAAKRLNRYKKEKKRIIAVGTTSARTLEAFYKDKLASGEKWIDLFIKPGYRFKFVDSLITNFHLPSSSLLILVSALASKKFILKAYKKAVNDKWRFYSFGDAMWIK